MKTVTNLYHKKLFFEINGKPVGIEPNDYKPVEDDIAEELLKSPWIKEVKKKEKVEKTIPQIKKTTAYKYKGRIK